MSTKGRGSINLTFSNPVKSHSGEYNCSIEGSRQQYPGVNNLSVYWIEMVNSKYTTERDVSNFEMKCRYRPSDMPLTGYKWKKIKEDGTTEIEDCSKDGRFEVTSYQNSILSLKIKNVILGNAGKYQCEVKPVDGENILKDTTQLIMKKAALKMEIPDVTTNEGRKCVELLLNITYIDDSAVISDIKWYKHAGGEAKTFLTSINSPENSKHNLELPYRYQCTYINKNKVYLEIRNIQFFDEGIYICEVEVEGKQKIYSCWGMLTVEMPHDHQSLYAQGHF